MKINHTQCLSITKNLVNAKLLVVSKYSVDTNLFSVGKHLVGARVFPKLLAIQSWHFCQLRISFYFLC